MTPTVIATIINVTPSIYSANMVCVELTTENTPGVQVLELMVCDAPKVVTGDKVECTTYTNIYSTVVDTIIQKVA